MCMPSPCEVSWLFSREGFDCLTGCLLQSIFTRLKPQWWVVPFVPVGTYSNGQCCIYMSQQIQFLPWVVSCKSYIKKKSEIVRSVAFIFNLKIGRISPTLIKIPEKKRSLPNYRVEGSKIAWEEADIKRFTIMKEETGVRPGNCRLQL